MQLEPVWNSEFRSYVWHHHDTLQLNVDNAPRLWLLAASLCSGLAGRKIEALAWNRASWIPILCPAPSACYYFCLCCCSCCCCCCTKNNIENVSETRRQLPALFSPAFFFLQLFLFVRFGNEFWLLLAGTRFGCTDPVSACYRFDKGQGVRCGVEWTPPPRGNCLLPPLALDCQFSQEFVPPTSIFCWPFYFCRFLCLLCSDLSRCPDVLAYIQTNVCNTYGGFNWYCPTFFELRNQSLIYFN